MFPEGVIEDGQIKLDPNVPLPEGATAYMIIPDGEFENNVAPLRSPRLDRQEQAIDFGVEVIES